MNKYQEWIEKSKEYNQDFRHPEMLDFTIKNMPEILRDFKLWEPEKHYKYMLTFTLDPKKFNFSTLTVDDYKNDVEDYICNLMRKPETKKCYYVREHDQTNCHWHVVVHRTSPIRSDYLSYYKKKFGSVDVSRSKYLEDTHSIKYLSKESEIVQII